MATQIKAATRMELLATKKRIKLATKGHKLLKEKRDALVSEFFKIISGLKSIRKSLEEQLADAFRSLIMAQAVLGINDVRRAAESSDTLPALHSSDRTIMGVRTPLFQFEKRAVQFTYSAISGSSYLDTAAKKFQETLSTLIKLAELEATVKRLAEEIKKTKRKVNALERILIPNLNQERVYITMRLEEMERENFSRLKIIKKRIEG